MTSDSSSSFRVKLRQARLLVGSGPKGRIEVNIDRSPFTIGRGPDCSVVVPDPLASKRHAEILIDRSDHVLRDLASRNGTHVNGDRVTARRLRFGDRIEIGQTTIVFTSPSRISGDQTRRGGTQSAAKQWADTELKHEEQVVSPLSRAGDPNARLRERLARTRRRTASLSPLLPTQELLDRTVNVTMASVSANRVQVFCREGEAFVARAWRARGEPRRPDPPAATCT
ncbi:FHA domain-containing protein [Planctomycetota bacterium]